MRYKNKCAGIVTKIPASTGVFDITGKPPNNSEWE